MEHQPQGGETHQPSPEQRERLQINGIIIPADDKQPLRQADLDPTSTDQFKELVGGDLELTALRYPPSSLYRNGNGNLDNLPGNRRATALLWMHSPALRYRDVVVGDALLVGPAGRSGKDTNVPQELANLLFDTKHFKVQVQSHEDPRWFDHGFRSDNWIDAYTFAFRLGMPRSAFDDVRVIPDEPPHQSQQKRPDDQQT